MNRNTLTTLAIASAAITVAVPAIAQMGGHMQGMHDQSMTRAEVETKVKTMFATVDANRDGTITKAEAEAAHGQMESKMRDAHFNEMDANKDGSISRAEFDAGHMRRGEGMKHEGGEKGEMGHRGGQDEMGKGRHGGMRMHMSRGDMFERADANQDGSVSLAEALAQPLARFDAADTNRDGTLSPQERLARHAKIQGMMHRK